MACGVEGSGVLRAPVGFRRAIGEGPPSLRLAGAIEISRSSPAGAGPGTPESGVTYRFRSAAVGGRRSPCVS
jgi:hypothetical protein